MDFYGKRVNQLVEPHARFDLAGGADSLTDSVVFPKIVAPWRIPTRSSGRLSPTT